MDKNILYDRYRRQMILKNFGEAGQQKLLQAKVLVVGAGGLGCPALQYLAGAGIGTIGIIDDDVVVLSNLHRQVLFTINDIGLSKATCAAAVLQNINPEIKIIAYAERLTTQNAIAVMEFYDIIIDGTDNFASRYLINDACVLLHKNLVYGAVSQYEGQVAVFNCTAKNAVNYRDLFPHPPKENEILNCAEAGVLGVLPGIIGTMQANETIKLITGIGKPLINCLLTYNALNNQMYELELSANAETRALIPKDKTVFEQTDYNWLCSTTIDPLEIDVAFFNELLSSSNINIIDVRELDELPVIKEFAHQKIPLSQLTEKISLINATAVVAICQSGKRSLQAAKQLTAVFGTSKKIYSLRGGITLWKQQQAKQLL
jgi:sulfur-carrier protein adenylyltransferase/sulfurtransferase